MQYPQMFRSRACRSSTLAMVMAALTCSAPIALAEEVSSLEESAPSELTVEMEPEDGTEVTPDDTGDLLENLSLLEALDSDRSGGWTWEDGPF